MARSSMIDKDSARSHVRLALRQLRAAVLTLVDIQVTGEDRLRVEAGATLRDVQRTLRAVSRTLYRASGRNKRERKKR